MTEQTLDGVTASNVQQINTKAVPGWPEGLSWEEAGRCRAIEEVTIWQVEEYEPPHAAHDGNK